jgi:hypothetical protein
MSDKVPPTVSDKPELANLQGQQLARSLEQGNPLAVERQFDLLQGHGDNGWKIAQAMKAAYDSDALHKSGFPELTIESKHNRIEFSLNARDAHPITAFGRNIDELPVPGFVKGMVGGTKESHDALNKWDASFGRNEAELLLTVGLNNDMQTTAFDLTRRFMQTPDRMKAVNSYLPPDRQLKIVPDAPSKESSCGGFNFAFAFGNETAKFSPQDRKALCTIVQH